MAIFYRSLPIIILCLGWVLLQYPDLYQSLICVYDVYRYNLQTITNLYYVSRMCMATISTPL
jgi:hypothetical protein